MALIILPLLFLGTGILAIWYYGFVPSKAALRERLPNQVSFAALIVTAVIVAGGWYALQKLGGRFDRVSGITTLVFFLLTFETFLLLSFRWLRSNTLAVLAALIVTAIPFTLQLSYPTYAFVNTIIILACLGATTLMVRGEYLGTKVIIVLAVLLAINDVIVVQNLTSNLPLTPIGDSPLRLLIFPTLVAGGRVVGSGDVMFLVLTTVLLVHNFGRQLGVVNIVLQSLALGLTLAATQNQDIFIPFLSIMTPIFLITYLIGKKGRSHAK